MTLRLENLSDDPELRLPCSGNCRGGIVVKRHTVLAMKNNGGLGFKF